MKIFLLSCFLLSVQFTFGQTNEFAPVGAKWWYDFSDGSAEGYKLLESIGDTIIGSKNCRVIGSTLYKKDLAYPAPTVDTVKQDNIYVYSDSGVVYSFTMGMFYQLYDFNSSIGNVWEVGGVSTDGICDSVGEVVVDSVNFITIGGFELLQMHTSAVGADYWGFGSKAILEKIGSLNYLLPIPSNCLFDFYPGGPLRCYYDNTIGYYQIDSSITCDFVTEIPDEFSEPSFYLWPNPINNLLNVSLENEMQNCLLSIFNLQGEKLYCNEMKQSVIQVDMSHYPSGIYVIEMSAFPIYLNYKIIKL